jgi:hypothetical protein
MTAYLQPGSAPVIEASAINNTGVTATLRAAVARIIDNLKNNVDLTLPEEAEPEPENVDAGPESPSHVAELLASARQVVASLESALERAREHERSLAEKLAQR